MNSISQRMVTETRTYIRHRLGDQNVHLIAKSQSTVAIIAPDVDDPRQRLSLLLSIWVTKLTPQSRVQLCAVDRTIFGQLSSPRNL